MQTRIYLVLFFGVICPINALKAYENKCNTYRAPSANIVRLCPNTGSVPEYQTRNFSGHHFSCSTSSKSFERHPEEFDFSTWVDTVKAPDDDGRWDAFTMRQQTPEPRYEGRLTFPVGESWSWSECVFFRDNPKMCGTDRKCIKMLNPDPHNKVDIETCQEIPKSCFAEAIYGTSLPCGLSNVDYNVNYVRPQEHDWNPDQDQYTDVLPNKYDLLPGETERFTLRVAPAPSLYFESTAYNEYEKIFSGTAVTEPCEPHKDYTLVAQLHTIKRNTHVQTPNNFVLPKSWDDKPIEPLEWTSGLGIDGKIVAKAYPIKVRVMDQSSSIMKFIAEESRANKFMNSFQKNPMTNNTILRIRIVHKHWLWDTEINKIYRYEARALIPFLKTLSTHEKIKQSDLWEINLDEAGKSKSIYKRDYGWFFRVLMNQHSFRVALKPDREYALRISMHHKGVDFYKQSCDVDRTSFRCRYLGWIFPRTEAEYYSPELEINFWTDKNYDERGSRQKFWEIFW